jgi:hypothetical protein
MDGNRLKNESEFEQATSYLANQLPSFWKRMYDKCQEQGFSKQESLLLVNTYILSQCPYGVRGS